MAAVWPVDVPNCPIAGTFREQRSPSVIRTETEVGPGKVRRRSTAKAIPTEFSLKWSLAQKAAFDIFFDEDLQSGVLRFDMKHPVGGAWHVWRFIEAPGLTRPGPYWIAQVAMTRLD